MKKRMSILIVVLLVLILIFSSFANAYANPVAAFVGSQMGRAAMTTVISGMLVKDFTDATIVTWDSIMALVDTTKWYFGQHKNGYGLSIPQEDLNLMANEIVNQLGGYGNGQIMSFSDGYLVSKNEVYDINFGDMPLIYFYNTTGQLISSMSHYTTNQAYSNIRFIGYDGSYVKFKYGYPGSWSTTPYSLPNDFIVSKYPVQVVNTNIPSETWNPNYLTDIGINYNGWMEQPGNRYIVNVPTTTDGLGNLIVDDVALANQTPDLARVNDRLNELQEVPVNDVETWNPVPPTTNPVTDPITDVASESWLDRLWSKFVNLFVLPDDYFIKNFQYLKNEVPMMAFPLQIINDVERMSTLQGGYLDDIWADGWGGHHKIVDFQFLRDMLPTFHNFLRGIMFILLLMYNYDQVYKLIRGNSYGFGHSRQEIIPQQIESPFKSLGRS